MSSRRCRVDARTAPIRRPSDRINFNGRIDHALTKTHTLRATFQQNQNEQRNLGVGSFDLPERAYTRTSDDSLLRLSESGPWSRNVFARVAASAPLAFDGASSSAIELPTVRVLDAFTAGGAQQDGGRTQHRDRVGDQHRLGEGEAFGARRARSSKAAGTAATAGRTTSGPTPSRASPTTRPAGRRPTRAAPATRSCEYSQWQAGSSCRTTGARART